MRRARRHQEDRLLGCVSLAPAVAAAACLLTFGTPPQLRAGWGDYYQLGSGNTADQLTPGLIADGGGNGYRAVACGTAHVCAVRTDDNVVCWGYNDDGRCGSVGETIDGIRVVKTPNVVAGEHRFKHITTGSWHTCGVTIAGVAMCWGEWELTSLRMLCRLPWQPQMTNRLLPPSGLNFGSSPTQVAPGQTFTRIAAGQGHTCALRSTGAAVCWGACHS